MEIVAKIKDGPDETKMYLAELSETEIDKVAGVSDKPHVPGRYRPGMTVNLSPIYDKVAQIVGHHAAIKKAMQDTRAKAEEIENMLPITEV